MAPEEINDFAPTGVTKPEDIGDIFDTNFYFGCEADDSLNVVAFDPRINHYGLKLNAIPGSDIGHWDAPDMTRVMVDAYEMVEDGLVTEDDFRDFSFGNVVGMHAGMNPDFFKGTVVADAENFYCCSPSSRPRRISSGRSLRGCCCGWGCCCGCCCCWLPDGGC